jgi:hypothetical protein
VQWAFQFLLFAYHFKHWLLPLLGPDESLGMSFRELTFYLLPNPSEIVSWSISVFGR